ncbi:splicing factor U2af large subunit B [Tanacetum coccineum]|uniref:Splicing factor U2af large subunit B n=1 Tax=Tanacetum coccineum TaxID=301880 RepID=A0ABQ5C4J0_9ASTR
MLMEVASDFEPIKAYHFEDNAHPGRLCAFVEYADQVVTVKACAGLNGMKLGGQVMTITQALQMLLQWKIMASNLHMELHCMHDHFSRHLRTPRTASSKAVDKSGAVAIQAAEVRATSSTLLITGGLVAQSQSDATLNRYEKCFGSCNPSFSQLRPVDAIEGEKDEAIASTN